MTRTRLDRHRVLKAYQSGTFLESILKRASLFLGVFLLVSLLAACGNAASSPTQTAAASTPTPTQEVKSSPIVGTYLTTITQQDIARMPDRAINLGTHTWLFNSDGTYNWIVHGQNAINDSGHYQLSQGELTLTDSFCDSLWSAPTGTYSWTLKGNQLILQAKNDGCLDRKFVLTSHPLIRQRS
jgi:hypothetical protein